MKHEIELRPFNVPNFVLPVKQPGKREDGFQEVQGIPLSDLSSEALDLLCQKFRSDVFKKAGKL